MCSRKPQGDGRQLASELQARRGVRSQALAAGSDIIELSETRARKLIQLRAELPARLPEPPREPARKPSRHPTRTQFGGVAAVPRDAAARKMHCRPRLRSRVRDAVHATMARPALLEHATSQTGAGSSTGPILYLPPAEADAEERVEQLGLPSEQRGDSVGLAIGRTGAA
eukprot:scaffold80127_cov31-Tisochrysis_lutea.AAC.2